MKTLSRMMLLTLIMSCASTPSKKTESSKSVSEQEQTQEVSTQMSGTDKVEVSTYVVKQYDTLMYIAFKVYGDYEKWREILEVNENLDFRKLAVGQTIYYKTPSDKFVWNKSGTPYLIQTGDSLSLISKAHFNTMNKWKDIYYNNLAMIKDPNKIFAGFTLYIPGFKKVALKK